MVKEVGKNKSPFWKSVEDGTMSDDVVLAHLSFDRDTIRSCGDLLGWKSYEAVKKLAVERGLVMQEDMDEFERMYLKRES
jgi:hypothetical protein